MATALPTGARASDETIRIRSIGVGDLRGALREGWDDFREKRGDVVFLGLIYPLIGLMAALAAFNQNWLPLLFPVAAGVSLLGPAVASGFYEVARRRELGEDASWRHALGVTRHPNFGSIVDLTGILLLIFLAWLVAAWVIYDATMDPSVPLRPGEFFAAVLGTQPGWQLMLIGNLVGLAFAVVVLAISVVSFPMLIDKPVSATTAIAASVRATLRNPVPIMLWGLIVAALLVLGSLPAFVGLAVVLPLLGYATWHLYRRVVER